MCNNRIKQFTIGLVLALTLATAVFAQNPIEQQSRQSGDAASPRKQKVSGLIVDRDGESLVVRDEVGSDINVLLTDNTSVRQHKKKQILGADTPQLGAVCLLKWWGELITRATSSRNGFASQRWR